MDSDDEEGISLREDPLEKCCFANEIIEVPESFCSEEEIFSEVLSIETWENELSQRQKERLKMMLPSFPTCDEEEKDETLGKLFSGENFKFGNPLNNFFERLKDGFMNPEVAEAEKALKIATHREYKNQQRRYHYCLLRQIVVSRKKLIDSAYMLPPDQPVKMQQFTAKPKDATLCERTRLRYFSILQDVRDECCEPNTSSEDENYPESSPPKVTRKHKKQLQILEASLSPEITRVMSTTAFPPGYPGSSHFLNRCLDMIEVSDERYREMLLTYKQKKLSDPEHPELDISKVDLNDMISRANLSKRPLLKIESHSKKRPKVQENADKVLKITSVENDKLISDIKPHSTTLTRQLHRDEMSFISDGEKCSEANLTLLIENQLKADSKIVKLEAEDRVCENTISSVAQDYYQYPTCFFSLLRDFFWDSAEMKVSASKLEEKVRVWQEGSTAAYHDWNHVHETWSDLVSSALRFLAGDLISILPENFVPFLDYKEKQQQWQWIGSGRDSEEQLTALCQHWFENKDDVSLDVLETSQGSPPPPRVLTGWTVRATTDEEKALYREQECIRYQNPHKAFTFRVHGYESVVGPVKGVYGKESGVNKAREHSLLISDRPPFVTILSLVRDAAARLPNGEGTRADICELLKDSQYLSLASDQQVSYIHTVVSGALDRLHYEKDPCVKYDVNRKLWIYLHRNRTEGEFERIHQAQAAAAKARKAVQKNKNPKPKNRDLPRQPPSVAVIPTSDSAGAFLNVDVTTVSPVTSHSPRGSGSPRTQGSPKHSHPAVNRHLIRNLPMSIQANAKLSVPVITDNLNNPRKSELIQTNLASSASSSSISLRHSIASTNTAICSPQHSLASSIFTSFPSDGNNSRPPSQGSVQSLPSPKTVIANVNAAQFVSVGSFQVGPTTVEQPVSSGSVAPCIGVLSVDMKSSSPSFVGQPPVLQPVLSHQTMATSSSLTCVSTATAASLISSTSGGIPKSKLVSSHHAVTGSKTIPGFQTIVIKPDAAIRAGGNLSSLPLLSAEELSAADASVLNSNPVVARFLHSSQLLSLGNLVTGTTSGNLLKPGSNTIQNFKIQGANFGQQTMPSSNVNLFQSRQAVASMSSDLKLPRLSVVSQESSCPETLIPSTSVMGPSAMLSFNQGAGISSLEAKGSSSHRELSEIKRITIPSHSLAEIKPTVADLGRLLDSAGAPNHVISSTSTLTSNISNYAVGKNPSSLVIGTQETLKPLASTYVMTSPITNASMLSSQHGLRAATSLNMRALHSIKVIPVPQSIGSNKNIRHAPLLARIISPSTGMTLRTALPSELVNSSHQLKGATAMNIVHGLQSVAAQSHVLKAAASHTCTNSEVPSQPFIIQVQVPKTANDELNL